MTKKIKLFHGFTLIELLLVITVIGTLATVGIMTFPAAQKRARDARRRSDLNQYKSALELYANKFGSFYYNSGGTIQADTGLCTALGLTTCAPDPLDGTSKCNTHTCRYYYNGIVTQYVLWNSLERPNPSEDYFIICSNGKTGYKSTAPGGNACPL